MRFFIYLIFIFFATGCTGIKLNGPETKTTKVNYPAINTIVTASVGDQLVQKGEIIEEKVLKVNSIIDGVLYDIPQGIYTQLGHDEKNDYFSSNGVIQSLFADPHKALMASKRGNSELCVVTVFNGKACYKGDYEIKNKISERGTSFQQTLIYSGRVGNKINIGYREFSNSMARPAFNNDVEYDLSLSNLIGYKGAQIEVIDADNNSIKYRVIRNFPWN